MGNVGTEIEQIKNVRDWFHLVSVLFSEDVSSGKQYLVTLMQESCTFKERTAVVSVLLICTMSNCSLHDDPEPTCLILGS